MLFAGAASKQAMTRTFTIRRSTVHERFDDENVIVNLDTGSYYSVQGTGSTIWVLLAAGASEAEIVDRMRAQFPNATADVAHATVRFLDQLIAEELADPTTANGKGAADLGALADLPGDSFAVPELQKYSDMEELLRLDPIHEVDEAGWPSARRKQN
jgi:hypothetical protein